MSGNVDLTQRYGLALSSGGPARALRSGERGGHRPERDGDLDGGAGGGSGRRPRPASGGFRAGRRAAARLRPLRHAGDHGGAAADGGGRRGGRSAGSCRDRRRPHCGASHRRAAAGQPRGAPPLGRRDRGGGGLARGRRRARARHPAPAARRPALRARRRRSPPRGSRAARARADGPARAAHRRDRPGRRHQHGLGWRGRLARGDVRPRPAARRGPGARPPARRRRLRPSARPLPPASRRRQPRRSLRQPRPRPFRAQGRQSPAGERDPLRRGGAGERHRLRPQRGDPVRPDDLRQLLDRADLRAALALAAALRADPARRHRPLAAVRGLGREPDLRLPEPQGLHARTR